MKHRLTLAYSISTGVLEPYFAALQDGRALASACERCGAVAFPPRAGCGDCGAPEFAWRPLDGTARILFRTDGGSGSFALVKFDGADTASTVALINPDRKTDLGQLTAPGGDAPGLWLALNDPAAGDDNEH